MKVVYVRGLNINFAIDSHEISESGIRKQVLKELRRDRLTKPSNYLKRKEIIRSITFTYANL